MCRKPFLSRSRMSGRSVSLWTHLMLLRKVHRMISWSAWQSSLPIHALSLSRQPSIHTLFLLACLWWCMWLIWMMTQSHGKDQKEMMRVSRLSALVLSTANYIVARVIIIIVVVVAVVDTWTWLITRRLLVISVVSQRCFSIVPEWNQRGTKVAIDWFWWRRWLWCWWQGTSFTHYRAPFVNKFSNGIVSCWKRKQVTETNHDMTIENLLLLILSMAF